MKVKCDKCKGCGSVPDMIERVASLGVSWLFDKMSNSIIGYLRCNKCNGKGYIKY